MGDSRYELSICCSEESSASICFFKLFCILGKEGKIRGKEKERGREKNIRIVAKIFPRKRGEKGGYKTKPKINKNNKMK